MDLVLGPFADAHLDSLDAAGLDRLEGLMEEQDTDLLKWVTGEEPTPPGIDAPLLESIVQFRKSSAYPQ